MDATQAIILSVIIVLAIFLVIIGVQVFIVLRDLRKTLKKVDRLIDDANDFVGNVKRPLESVSNLVTAVTAGAGIAQVIKRLTSPDSKHERSEK